MKNIESFEELKKAIQLLELEQTSKIELLKEQALSTYDRFRLINILKNSLKQTIESPTIMNDIVGTTIGLATRYLSRKLFVGSSGNVFRKLLGSILQLGTISYVSQHSSGVKSLGKNLLAFIFRKKE